MWNWNLIPGIQADPKNFLSSASATTYVPGKIFVTAGQRSAVLNHLCSKKKKHFEVTQSSN